MTSLYTFVAPERQNELTRRIQQKLTEAQKKQKEQDPATVGAQPAPSKSEALPKLRWFGYADNWFRRILGDGGSGKRGHFGAVGAEVAP
jgi:hypothetical protein